MKKHLARHCLIAMLILAACGPLNAAEKGRGQKKDSATTSTWAPTSEYKVHEIEGWKVLVHKDALAEKELCAKALRLLKAQLYDVTYTVPAKPLAELRKIPLWIERAHPRHPCACYHPSREWLAANDFNPEKAGGVEIANIKTFLDWSHAQPSMVLHELAHGYHHQTITHQQPDIQAAFEAAKKKGNYERVLYFNGDKKRAYALNNIEEYFAEATEAFFGQNDFYPFVRAELRQHDRQLYDALKKVWRD